jgi:hypothetical protein
MAALAGHQPLRFRLFATGQVLAVDGRSLTLISARLSSLTLITGFAVFAVIRKPLAFDQRLVFAGYRQPMLIAGKTAAIAVVPPRSPPRPRRCCWHCGQQLDHLRADQTGTSDDCELHGCHLSRRATGHAGLSGTHPTRMPFVALVSICAHIRSPRPATCTSAS